MYFIYLLFKNPKASEVTPIQLLICSIETVLITVIMTYLDVKYRIHYNLSVVYHGDKDIFYEIAWLIYSFTQGFFFICSIPVVGGLLLGGIMVFLGK